MIIEPIIISPQQIENHYAVLNHIGALADQPDAGFSRAAYSDEETAVMNYFAEQAELSGLKTRWDAIGNLFIETVDKQTNWIECGSHVDTVPAGGNFDGLAGIVAGFVAIATLNQKTRSHGLRLRIWRGEEPASFGITSIGASAALGLLAKESLKKRHAGRSLAQAIREQGADPSVIESGQPTITQDELDQISVHLELHIEQGIVLEKEVKDIGIVSGIRASSRDWITLHGAFDHSGATPMGKRFRRDANLALAHILVVLDDLFCSHQNANPDIDMVQTIGHINSNAEKNNHDNKLYNNAISKVSGYAYFSYELRSCETLNYSHRTLPSGAWHDAALIAQQTRRIQTIIPTGMIFVPCLNGKSHSPEEFASAEQIAKGASVLATLIKQRSLL